MEKFKLAIKKEIFLYLVMLLVFTLLMHSDLFTNPSSRFEMMVEKENYSHPFIYTFVIYSILFIIRKVVDFIANLFDR
jgi:hypothetical protein